MRVLTTEDLADMPEPAWLLQEFYAEKSTTMVYGPWGLGKSFMVLDQVLTVSTGADWYGDRGATAPLKTLYVVAEGAAWWYRRIQAYERERGPIDRDNLLWIPEPVNLWTPSDGGSDVERFEEVLQEHRPDLMVFDTWVRCTAAFGMNEDKATDTSQVIRQLDRLRDHYDVTPIIVHHPTKSGNFRGSGNQGASVERIIELKAVDSDPFSFDVHDEKGNHLEPFPDFRMRFEGVDIPGGDRSAVIRYEGVVVGTDDRPNWDKIRVAAEAAYKKGQPISFADLQRITNIPSGSMSRAVKDAMARGFLEKEEDGYALP